MPNKKTSKMHTNIIRGSMVEEMVEPGGLEPPTDPCEGSVIPLNYGPKTW